MIMFSGRTQEPAPDPPMVNIDVSFLTELGKEYHRRLRMDGFGTAPLDAFNQFEYQLNNNQYWFDPPEPNDHTDPRTAKDREERAHRIKVALDLLRKLAEYDTQRYEVITFSFFNLKISNN